MKKQTEEWLIAHDEVSKLQEETIKPLGKANKKIGDFRRVKKKKKKKVKTKNKKKITSLMKIKKIMASRSIFSQKTMLDVAVEEDDAVKGRNRQDLRDIRNVRRNHPKNDPVKINHPRTRSQHAPLIELVKHVVKRVVVPKPMIIAEKSKDVEFIEISVESDEEHGSVAVQEKKSIAAKKKTAAFCTSVLTARSKTAYCFEKKQKEDVVDIDSAGAKDDHAAVEYMENIYSFYKSVESEWRPGNYMRPQPKTNEKMGLILVEWLVDVCVRFELKPETFYLTEKIMHQFLFAKSVPREKLQLVGINALLMTSKYNEI